ncbi:L-cysteine desulfhydrase-like protein [Yamadazyma tenuis]|uniref:PLP-dependent transferase n=1 Tax=Candida tenuis (strain ATCC 10573 / BCRC 21748 / CBS 615 / JCM 9827 / NBRC 10315 / NRRL Y-1498 / VKM Y-70) TaxID=590646 RepID=G3B7H1_CANTC|nr:uncharacterized protein CANTEDRAFT_115732 [Yamadazyma tenuis ATCC 10573]XP_006689008.1 PLP-dependent transferase [Yamadazyma tenuis ATCC 10573]EGV62837.1 hypothetical protein CANTEDRAFT_115732 [Yamadazyma tenuis ATCC 10573]EGV62838.1 PLP-dependent transferase [Yamadazyma tenuis ATCC 10573]WEJ93533.1 L-cysteine desulfhydrase-like protein [Yamadazyma tenuis]
MFGEALRKSDFSGLSTNVTPVNHGSYGLPPDSVVAEFQAAMADDLSFPDRYMFVRQPQDYVSALKTVGDIIHCDYHDVAIVNNSTSGVNTVLKSFPWKRGDKLLLTSVVYPACENIAQFTAKMNGVEVEKMVADIEKGQDHLLAEFEKKIKSGGYRMAMFDVVSSMPAFLFPYEQMVQVCRENGVLSMVDGAHGVGLVPLDLGRLQPDFFVSNLHKWFFTPRGTALLYVNKKHHATIQPLVQSHVWVEDVGEETLIKKFTFAASDNYAKLRCIEPAKQFRDRLGGDDAIWNYAAGLRDQVMGWLSKRWGMEELGDQRLMMANIWLPEKFVLPFEEIEALKRNSSEDGHFLQIGFYQGRPVLRLSFQVYNEVGDYEKAIEYLEKAIEKRLEERSLEKGVATLTTK